MLYTYTQCRSKNGILFHHSRSTFENGEKEILSPELHDAYEIFILLSGKVTYVIDGKSYHVSPLEVVLIPPNVLHSMEIDNSEPYERMVLTITANLLPKWIDYDFFASFQNARAFANIIPRKYTEKYQLNVLFEKIAQTAVQKQKHHDAKLLIDIIPLLMNLIDCSEELLYSPMNSNLLRNRNDQFVHECVQYINENISIPLTVHNLAEKFHLSASHIQHVFKKQTGTTVQTYIFNQRMQLAQKLLFQGYLPQTVARMLGYEYYSTFNYHFKKRYHDNPKCFAHIRDDVMRNFQNERQQIKKDT